MKAARSNAFRPGSSHITKKGNAVAASRDETETILLAANEQPQIAAVQISTAGHSPSNTPAEVATPFPPLKFSHGEKIWPATAANPVSTDPVSPACRNSAANQTASHPLSASKVKTRYPHFFPKIRPTLVAPILPLPLARMSTPLVRANQNPHGRDPRKKPMPSDSTLSIIPFGMGEEPEKGKEIHHPFWFWR